jgi:hypothetical protein
VARGRKKVFGDHVADFQMKKSSRCISIKITSD